MTNSFVWSRAIAIAKKEVFHILRDPFTLALALVMPIFMVVIYGIAIDFNVKNIHLAVSDSDQSQSSRRLIETFGSSHYFIPFSAGSPVNTLADIEAENARASLIIPPRFEKDLLAGRSARVQILVDGADNSAVGSITGYVGAIQTRAAKNIADFDPPAPYELRTRFLFNPELNSRWFVIPGLTVVVMAILSILLTALTVAREWENGSMELLLSTPVQPLEIIIGKLTPYGVLGIIAVTFVFVIARVGFGVPFVGNIFVFGAGCLLFLVTYLAQGLLISVTTRKQMVAMQFAMLTGFLPSQLLSGFVFPVSAMPPFFRYFTMIFPARWFMEISRDTFLKGSNVFDLWMPFCALTFLCVFMIRRATQKFKRDLEP
jgi:ABC-2 type transport system permease protein